MSWSKRLNKYLFLKKFNKADIFLIFLVMILAVFGFTFRMPFKDAVQSKIKITLGYCAKSISDNTFCVLDNEHTRVICFNQEGDIRFTIEKPSDEKGDLSYIDDFAITEKGIYVSASQWDGMALAREAILFFNLNGEYIKTIRDCDYSSNRINKHRFYGISEYEGVVQYVECQSDSILIGEREIPYSNAFNAVSDAVFVGSTAYILDKNGTIREYTDGKSNGKEVFSLSTEEKYDIVPYKLAVDRKGNLYFTNIKKEEIRLVDTEKGTSSKVSDSLGSLTVGISNSGKFLLLDGSGLHVFDENNDEKVYSELNKTGKEIAFQIIWLIALAALILLVFIMAFRLFRLLSQIKFSPPTILGFWVFGTVAVVSVILCSLLMNSFAANYRSKLVEQLECTAYMIANQIDPEDIEGIEETGGFGGTAYNRLCEIMEDSFSADIEFYDQIYCNVLRLDTDGETGYAVAYLDQSIGSYFPLSDIETKELQKVYETGKIVRNDEVADISGNYLSVKVPVFNVNGQVCGVVAVGAENYIVDEILQTLVKKIWFSIAIILMIVWLVSVEVFSFANNYSVYKKEKEAGNPIFPAHTIRLLIFMVFAAYNMTAAFLPVYLLRQSDSFTGKMKEIAGAFPITINLFLIGIMSLFCARLVRRFGLRKIMIVSAACSLLGNSVIYFFSGFYPALLGLILDGIGVGLITNAVYVMVTYIKEEENRTWGLRIYNGAYLSGINFGMLVGSVLAVNVGQRMVFGIVAAVWSILAILTWCMIRNVVPMSENTDKRGEEPEKRCISFRKFIFQRTVLGFIILIQNPYIIFGSFIFYYVPIFCDVNGLNETICSILIMLYSQVAVLGTDFFTKTITKIGRNSGIYLCLAINIAALLLFATMPGIGTMTVSLILMGISSAFGKPVQQNYYLSLESTQKYGEDKAMGIYNFTENIGESAGPMIFGRMMGSDRFGISSIIFCGVIGVLTAIHYWISKKEKKDEKRR